MDPIKEAFIKVREDIDMLFYNYQQIYTEIAEIKSLLNHQNNELKILIQAQKQHIEGLKSSLNRTLEDKTIRQINSDTPSFPFDRQTDTSTDILPLEALKNQNYDISTRNNGVSTDRQTHRQTDNTLNQIPKVLESLIKIKEEVRIKFRQLTKQEITIFATIYQLEEQGISVDYNLLAQRLNITESSIRDHIGRIIKKGIPLEKTKEKNKRIILRISNNFKEIASLDSILKLKENRLTE